jgi:type I restriction enzyme, S subunit
MTPYPKYKPSGIEWIGEIPEHWNTIAIKHLVSTKVTDGPHETPEFLEEGVPFVSAEAVKDGKIDFNFKRGYISKELDIEYSGKCKPQRGDVFIVKSGSTTGKIAYVDFDEDFNVWSPLALIRTKSNVNSKFIFYSFSSAYFLKSIQLFWSFGTQPNIGMNVIENLRVVVPPAEEQTKATVFLDEKIPAIDTAITKKQKLIELLKEEKTAIINEAVTKGIDKNVKLKPSGIEWLGDVPEHWEVKKLKYVASLKSGEGITSDLIKEIGEYPVYGGNGLRGFFSKYTHEGTYILIGRQGALCGNINYGTGKFWATEHAVVVTILDGSEVLWLGELLRLMNLNQYSVAAAQPGLSVDNIVNLKIPVPDHREQWEIGAYIEKEKSKIAHTIERIEKEIELLQEYRVALINEVVTGKVRVV